MVSLSDDVIAFFERLVVPESHFLEIRIVTPDRPGARQVFCRTTDEAVAVVQRLSGTVNVYVGACPRSRQTGSREAVTVVTCAWADLDFHHVDPTDRRRAEQASLERVCRFGHRPTILVHTGNGLQGWWLYDQPQEISSDHPPEQFEAINKGLARALGGDAVHDIARVLRVPGTVNLPDEKKRARGCVSVTAKLIHCDGPTYAPDDFRHIQAHVEEDRVRSTRSRTRIAVPTQPDLEVVEAFLALLRHLPDDHLLVRTWVGDRALQDRSRSGWDMALVNQLYRARIREEFIPCIVRAFGRGRGVFATDDYILRTMAKARARRRNTREAPRSA